MAIDHRNQESLDPWLSRIDDDTLWSIIQADVPDLLEKLRELRQSIGSSN
jgi:uncharacterized protein with HEPN domain